MKYLRQLFRLIKIAFVVLRYGLEEYMLGIKWFKPLKLLYYLYPPVWFRKRDTSSKAKRIRLALEAVSYTHLTLPTIYSV